MLNVMTQDEAFEVDRLMPGNISVQVGSKLKYALDRIASIGTTYYVDATNGSDGNNGLSWGSALKTIQKAVNVAVAGDTLMLIGTFTEAVTCAKSLNFIGAGAVNDKTVWMESAVGQTLLTLTGKDCYIANIRFRIPQTNGVGIAMTQSDYTVIQNCVFQGRTGSYYAITNNGGSQCEILGNVFCYLNTATYGTAIFGVTYTAIPTGWRVIGNTFHSNLRHISMTMRQSLIKGNIFQAIGLDADNTDLTATVKLDIYTGSAGGGQYNTVFDNILQGTYSISGGYKSSANDDWAGNMLSSGSASTTTPA